jgi:plasmid stabilization system protein ParE
MTNEKLLELEAIARAADGDAWDHSMIRVQTTHKEEVQADKWNESLDSYIKDFNPTVALALLAELRSARELLSELKEARAERDRYETGMRMIRDEYSHYIGLLERGARVVHPQHNLLKLMDRIAEQTLTSTALAGREGEK